MTMCVSPKNSAPNEHVNETAHKVARRARNLSSIVTTIGAVLFGLLLSILAQKALKSDFVGSGSRLVDMCKKNPKYNPEVCGPIIEARAPSKPRSSRETGIEKKSLPFQLSEDE